MTEFDLSDLRITPDSYDQFDYDPSGPLGATGPQWINALDAHTSINDVLDANLGDRHDWGAKYNEFLSGVLGLPANSDNGWWSRAAVEPGNLIAFMRCVKSPELLRKLQAARAGADAILSEIKGEAG